MKTIIVVTLAFIAGCSSHYFSSDPLKRTRREATGSVLRVSALSHPSKGTGFITSIKDKPAFITNAHVCHSPTEVLVAEWGKDVYPLIVTAFLPQLDLCICEIIGGEKLRPLTRARYNNPPGTAVTTAGFPLGRYFRVMMGEIEAYNFDDTPIHMATSIFAVPGQSGSPVFNEDMEVVGVLFAVDHQVTHTAFVIPVDVLNNEIVKLEKLLDESDDSAHN
jgi:S1-C subfamily serine protease